MGDDDSEENRPIFWKRTLTQNHLDTLKITFGSYWDVSCRYLMENVARQERTACQRTTLPQQWAEWLVAVLLTAHRDNLEELQQQWTRLNWLSDNRKWRVMTSREVAKHTHAPALLIWQFSRYIWRNVSSKVTNDKSSDPLPTVLETDHQSAVSVSNEWDLMRGDANLASIATKARVIRPLSIVFELMNWTRKSRQTCLLSFINLHLKRTKPINVIFVCKFT